MQSLARSPRLSLFHKGWRILLESELGFSPKWFSGRGLGVGANETVWDRVVALDGVVCILNFSRLLVGLFPII